MKFAAYNEADWVQDVEADSEAEALAKAQAADPKVTRVELVSSVDHHAV
ncbi:MAG: hypothetical protein ACXWPM_00720 [Bdellovibrionota bacterium]